MVNAADVVFASSLPTDKLLGSYTGSFVATQVAANSSATYTAFHETSISETTFVVGIFSVDGGNTWNRMEASLNHSDNQGSLQVYAESTASRVYVRALNSRTFSAPSPGQTYTVQYKIMLIAKPDQGIVSPQPIGSSVYFDSRKNYQKIAVDDYRTINGTGTTTTVTHDLGYIPRVIVFYEIDGVLRARGGITSSRTDITSATVSVFFSGSVTNGKLYTRIYYNA